MIWDVHFCASRRRAYERGGMTTAIIGPCHTSLAVLQPMHVQGSDAAAMLPGFTAILVVGRDDSGLPTPFEL